MSEAFNALVAPAPVALTNDDERRSSLDSSLVKIGLYLARTFTNTIAKRQKKSLRKPPSASNSITPSPRPLAPPNLLNTTPLVTLTPPPDIASLVAQSSPRNAQSNAIQVTQSQLSPSPRRRRKGRSSQSNDSSITRSPRKGRKSKQRRVTTTNTIDDPPTIESAATPPPFDLTASTSDFQSGVRPTTELMGWRRLHVHEITRLSTGDEIIIVIPATTKKTDGTTTTHRNNFLGRVMSTAIKSLSEHFHGLPKKQRDAKALKMLRLSNGIKRNRLTYIKLPCTVTRYPHRRDYLNPDYSPNDMRVEVNNGGGVSFRLRDYPTSEDTLLKWKELNSVQFFVAYFRGDTRPQVHFRRQLAHDHLHAEDLAQKFDVVRDDYVQTLELALAFEKCKSSILAGKLKKASKGVTACETRNASMESDEFVVTVQKKLRLEMTPNNLHAFAYTVNKEYNDAWHRHYSDFQPYDALLST